MDLVACSKCGKIHQRGFRCNANRTPPADTKSRQLRRTYAWRTKSKQIRQEAQHLCEVCRDQNIYTYDGLEVHHITKIADDPAGLLDDNNLICLCTYHHKEADEGRIDTEYLRKLAKERGER